MSTLIQRLHNEASSCRKFNINDIAALLDEAVTALARAEQQGAADWREICTLQTRVEEVVLRNQQLQTTVALAQQASAYVHGTFMETGPLKELYAIFAPVEQGVKE